MPKKTDDSSEKTKQRLASGATGFFYRFNEEVYLITARHNLVPTNSEFYNVSHFLPDFDVFLRSPSEERWEKRRTSIYGTTVVNGNTVDLIAVKVGFSPMKYGYRIFSSEDIVNVEEYDGIDSVGFSEVSFPDEDAEYSEYTEKMKGPRCLSMSNVTKEMEVPRSDIGVGRYEGKESCGHMSGSPILADGLAGVHLHDEDSEQGSIIKFLRARSIEDLFNSEFNVVEEDDKCWKFEATDGGEKDCQSRVGSRKGGGAL
jgi:hypothetical protein